jgi:preprotein translocase subunit SecG
VGRHGLDVIRLMTGANEQGSDSFGLSLHRRGVENILRRVGFISICCDFFFCCLLLGYFPVNISVVLNPRSDLALTFID